MKKIFTILSGFISIFSLGQSNSLVISEIYGGGGSSNASYKNDYLQVFNLSSLPVDLGKYTVQISRGSGNSWNVVHLSGILQPNHWYLIKGRGDDSFGNDLPAPDATGDFNLNTANGKVALVNGKNALTSACKPFNEEVVDFVGFGNDVDCSEGQYAPGHTNTSATSRSNFTADANNNSTDFSLFPPNPRNTSSILLPVTLNDFSVNKTEKTNHVHWQVNCLSNSVTFEIERSSTTQNFESIYKATETKARCAMPFDFTDVAPQNGSNYYRIKIIDIDGNISYSKIALSVNTVTLKRPVEVTPNIVSSQAEIHYTSQVKENIQLVVTDMQGRVIAKTSSDVISGNNRIVIQTGGIASGQYQIRIFSRHKGGFESAPFIKQ